MGFWQDKLNGVQPQRHVIPPPSSRDQYYTPPAPATQAQEPHQPHTVTVTPPSDHVAGTCPSCGSGNYYAPETSMTTKDGSRRNLEPRCFSCGYPRVQFSSGNGEGGTMHAERGKGSAARRPASMETEAHLQTWNPAEGGAGRITG